MNRWSALAVLLAVAGALALRVPKLSNRPLHNDEAVNAVKAAELWQHDRYAYDPDEYHGPALHYATLPFLWLSGAHDADHLDDAVLRYAPVAFGVGLILLLLLFADGLGRHTLVWAALFIAVSPAMVFYSRYFIHEMSLVFYTALTLGAGWRYAQTRRAVWAVVAGTGVGLMFATKETFVITLGAMGLAGIITAWWNTRLAAVESNKSSRWKQLVAWIPQWQHCALALLATFVVWLLFFSSFFTNFGGLVDSFRTYLPWLKRAGGHSPHIHPWSFYLERLAWFHPKRSPVWSEGLILILATIGAGVSLFGKKSALHRFLALYTIILTAAYSLISYKTPWCLLNFFHGMILIAGVGAVALVEFFQARSLRAVVIVALLGLTAQLTVQSWRASITAWGTTPEAAADRRNPYVYAQTAPDLLNLVRKIEGIAGVASTGHATVVKVIAPGGDYWPLPWYLRRFERMGWYNQLPTDPFAPIVVISSKLDARLDDKSDKKWIMAGISEMRPGVFLELYVELELWKKYVAALPREQD
jgi:uncharacterized protein (TIGR03663 family)